MNTKPDAAKIPPPLSAEKATPATALQVGSTTPTATPTESLCRTCIQVAGIGGAGVNACAALRFERMSPQLIAYDTDSQTVGASLIVEKRLIGRTVTRGLSTGGDPDVGRKATESDREMILKDQTGVDLLFLIAGLGGGTGGNAAIVAEAAGEKGAVVIAFAILPFHTEGARRQKQAQEALVSLRKHSAAVILLPNDLLLQQSAPEESLLAVFARANEWIGRGVRSVCAMLTRPGLVNVDFGSLRSVFAAGGGRTLFGFGSGTGTDPVGQALTSLYECPLLFIPESAYSADHLIINVSGGAGLSMGQVDSIVRSVTERFRSGENNSLGVVLDEKLGDRIEICIIGSTRLEAGETNRRRSSAAPKAQRRTDNSSGVSPLSAEKTPHTGKNPKAVADVQQSEFALPMDEVSRGIYKNTEPNLVFGQDLDIPSYLRLGVKIEP